MADVQRATFTGASGQQSSRVTGLTITGTDRLQAVLTALGERALAAAAAALKLEAELIMTSAKQQTPVDTGALRASGHVQDPLITGTLISIKMGFGGPAGTGENTKEVGYATYVHEDLSAHHPVGNAKFLERAVLAAAPSLEQALARDLRKALEKKA